MAHILWFTGLSGSGKSTLANRIKKQFPKYVLLDGDALRKSLSCELGFSIEDRKENMRRLIELCKIFIANDISVITAFISPFDDARRKAKEEIETLGGQCYIIWCKCSLAKCQMRDPKGLYMKVAKGEIENFTGITSPYEPPSKPYMEADLVLDTERDDVNESVNNIIRFLIEKKNVLY